MDKMYGLPKLEYGYDSLEPHISQEQLRIHHDKHHDAYVKGANALLKRLDDARADNKMPDMKATAKELSWQIGGHILHTLYWENMSPKGGGEPKAKLLEAINKEFGSLARFREEFNAAAASVEGSGWTALAYCALTKRLFIMQIEKHNSNIFPMLGIILVMDMFEHAYYIDHKNDKAKYIEAFWKVVNWDVVEKRLAGAMG